MSQINGIKAAQGVLATVNPNLIVDGYWGSFTQKTYDTAPETVRLYAQSAYKAVTGKDLSSQTASEPAQKRGTPGAVSSSVKSAIDAAAQEIGVPSRVLYSFADIESNFNPNAVNGSSKGLFQIQPAAWKDASKIVPLRPYDQAVFDPKENARAAAAYMKILQSQLRALGYDGAFSPAVLYLAHQQGAGGFVELWTASKGVVPKTNYVTAVRMAKNPPQDKRGVTKDRKEFYTRWMAVAEAKFAKYM